MRLTLFRVFAAAVAVGLGLVATAQAETPVSGFFGIDAQSNPISGWLLSAIPGGAVGANITSSITTTSGLAGIADHGHGVVQISFTGAGANSAEVQRQSSAGTETTTGFYSSPNSDTGNNTPWWQISWIDNNHEGTNSSDKTESFFANYTTPLGATNDNRVTTGSLFGAQPYVAQRYDPGGVEAIWGTTAGAGVPGPGSYVEHTTRFEKNADGTFNVKVDGGAAYGNYEVDNIDFFSGTGTDPTEGGAKANLGTSWGIWQDLELRRRSAEVGDVAYFTDLKLGSLAWVKGDMNGDEVANNFDISAFELALVNPGNKATVGSYVNSFPLVTDYQERGDVNYDHALDNFDISPFETALVGGFGPGAAVPEPSTFVLLGLGGVGLLLSRVRKSLSAKWLKVAAVLLVVSLAVSVGTAQASTIFLSTTSTNPALTNPSVTTSVGGSVTLYAFWAPTTELVADQTDYPGYTQNEQLSGWSHNVVDDNAILSQTSYAFLNPTTGGSPRWGATNTGTSGGTFLVSTANAVKVGGSNLGFTNTAAQGYSNVGNGVYRLATLTFTATAAGTSHLFEQVGPSGISFQLNPNARSLNFGFGDSAITSNQFNTGSSLADATITVVPEPGTLALLGMGAVGLAAIARRRRRVA